MQKRKHPFEPDPSNPQGHPTGDCNKPIAPPTTPLPWPPRADLIGTYLSRHPRGVRRSPFRNDHPSHLCGQPPDLTPLSPNGTHRHKTQQSVQRHTQHSRHAHHPAITPLPGTPLTLTANRLGSHALRLQNSRDKRAHPPTHLATRLHAVQPHSASHTTPLT
jgi:hypothetical protein